MIVIGSPTAVNCGDGYTDAATIQEPAIISVQYAVAGNDAVVELSKGTLGQLYWSPEFRVQAGQSGSFTATSGIRFRNAVSGKVAAVTAVGFTAADPQAANVALSATVSVSPSNVNIEHNGVSVASQPTLDFEDETTFLTWTVVNDNPNTRVQVTPAVKVGVQLNDVGALAQPIIDFQDAGVFAAGSLLPPMSWILANDNPNTRIKVTPTLATPGVPQVVFDSGYLSGSSASFDTSGVTIPQTGGCLMVVIVGRSTGVATSTRVVVRFNGDSGANYDDNLEQWVNAVDTNLSNAAGATALSVGEIPAASATANKAGVIRFFIPGFSGTTFHKNVEATGFAATTATAAGQFVTQGGGTWRNTGGIIRIQALPNVGSFAAGSRMIVYEF